MANLSSIKAVRTHFRNTLKLELQTAKDLLCAEFESVDKTEILSSANKSAKMLKGYCVKLEAQMCKLTDAVSDSDETYCEQIVDEDCELIQQAENCLIDLDQLSEHLNTCMKSKAEEPHKGSDNNQFLELQQQMQHLIATQMKHQQELVEGQEQRGKEKENTVKLPKLDLITFNGNRLKWAEFWDSFECTVHTNKKLSPIEKFNYLQSKLVGEAERAIAGLALSNENYAVAIALLKERFGNKQEVVDLHYQKLINIAKPSANVNSLRIFMNTVERHIRSLEVLEDNVDQHVFISMIRSKLPAEALRQLEFTKGSKNVWTVHKLIEQLRKHVIACERAENKGKNERFGENRFKENVNRQQRPNSNTMFERNKSRYSPESSGSAGALTANVKGKAVNTTYKDKYRYCSEKHWSDEYSKYKTIDERKHRLRGSCFKCLKEGHKTHECKSSKLCVHCGEINVHHRSLCPKNFGMKIQISSSHLTEEVRKSVQAEQDKLSEGHVLISSEEMILMQTAKTEIVNPKSDNGETARILLDSGSQRTYVTEKLASKLGLKAEFEQELKLVTFGSEKTKVIKTKSTKLSMKLNNGKFIVITANIVPTISGVIQRNPVSKLLSKRMEHLINSVNLSDTILTATESSTADVLIGNDYYLDIVLPERIEIEPGLYLLSSKLGWILTGRTQEMSNKSSETSMLILTYGNDVTRRSVFSSVDSAVQKKPDLEDFWNVESIGITDKPTNTNDEIALQKFKETLKFDNNRYQVTWPWREEVLDLPVNRQLALGRLRSTVRGLRNKPELLNKYNSVIEDQLSKGVIEKIVYNFQDGPKHYIPHHVVTTPQKSTTKLRVVYDASAKSREANKSLNECLYRGPVMLQDLCGILMRFRLHKIALVADIEKACLQIGLQPDQRDVTRFLWLKDCNVPFADSSNVQEYRFCRVPFGIISSPFLLSATVQCHMDKYNTEIAEKVKKNIYVDNVITGAKTENEAIDFYNKAKSISKKLL